jgi:hypothetical protein
MPNELATRPLHDPGEPELLEHRGGCGGVGAARLGDEPDVLGDREVLVERRRLVGEPDLAAHRARRRGRVLTGDPDRPAARHDRPGHRR